MKKICLIFFVLTGVAFAQEDAKSQSFFQKRQALYASDSLAFSARKQEGYEKWQSRTRQLPRLESVSGEQLLNALTKDFVSFFLAQKEKNPHDTDSLLETRFHIYLADTLNPALWSQGGGFMVLHGGLLSLFENFHQFVFLITLEVAHELLGHPVPDKAAFKLEEPLATLVPLSRQHHVWEADGLAALALRDPIADSGFSFSKEQEAAALHIVRDYFVRYDWDFHKTAQAVLAKIKPLEVLHRYLPIAFQYLSKKPVPLQHKQSPALVKAELYKKLRQDLARSSLQRYPWFWELTPYLPFIQNPGPSAAVDLQRLTSQKPFESDITRLWLTTRVYFNHENWLEALRSTEEAAQKHPHFEPLLIQRIQVLQILRRDSQCLKELNDNWDYAEYKRKIFNIQCTLLKGYLTEALQQAEEYVNAYPLEVQGDFWRAFLHLRLRMPHKALLQDLSHKWGDRPYIRALRIIAATYDGDRVQARALSEQMDDDVYTNQETAALDFARAWFLRQEHDPRAEDIIKRSQPHWLLLGRMSSLLHDEI